MGEFIKYDVSKLSGRGDVLPKKVEERVFLGSDNEGLYRRQISKIAGEIEDGGVLNESNSNRRTQASKILKDNFNVVSLKDLRDGQQDLGKAEYVRENLKRSEERLAKAVLVSMKRSGVKESDLVSPEKVDERLPEGLKGLGEAISSFIITDNEIKGALETVELYRNGLRISDYDEKKEMVLGQIDYSLREIRKVLNLKNVKQVELASNYLNSLKEEITRNREKESVTDEIVTFVSENVLRNDVMVDDDLNLISSKGIDVFEKKPGTDDYKNPETVKWMREREAKTSELIMICSGGEFTAIEEINEKLKEGGISEYYTGNDGTRGDKEYLDGLKDTLGFCVYEAIQDSRNEANITILGTLNTNRVNKLLPMTMEGLSDDVVINVAQNPFLREQLKSICLMDKDKSFTLMSIHGGFSSIETKQQLVKDISNIVGKITGDKKMGMDKKYTSEARRIERWLLERKEVYNQLIERQIRIGRYGEKIPNEPEAKNERLRMVREWLNYVEASGSPPGSLNIMDQVTKLFEATQLEFVEPEIKAEIGARLDLAFMYYHMHAAGGLLGVRGQSIEDAHEQGYKEGCLINQSDMSFMLKDGANGIPVAECWDIIEDLNFGYDNGVRVEGNDSYYRLLLGMMGMNYMKNGPDKSATFKPLTVDNEAGKLLISMKENGMKFLGEKGNLSDEQYLTKWTNEKKIKFIGDFFELQNEESLFWGRQAREYGKEPMHYNYFTDANTSRKGMVKDFVLDKIKKDRESKNASEKDKNKLLSTDKKVLEKGFELAEKLLEATAETSVFNPCFAGHNDFSELILTEANTKDRQKKMKVIGSRVAMKDIISFYTTFPRYLAGEGESGRKSVFGPLHTKDINVARMGDPKSDSYFLYTAILPKKIIPVQSFFMKEDVGTKDVLSVEYWKKLFDPFSKVIGYSQDVLRSDGGKSTIEITRENKSELIYRLRTLAVKGVVQMATRPTTGWDWGSLFTLGHLVTTPYTMEDVPGANRRVESFITKENWKDIFNGAELAEEMRQRLIILNAAEKSKMSEEIKLKIK